MFCTKCGAKVSDSSVFCVKCGNRLKKEQTSNQEKKVQEVVCEPVQTPKKKEKKKNSLKVVILLLCLLIVLGLAFLAILIFGTKNFTLFSEKKDKVESEEVEAVEELSLEEQLDEIEKLIADGKLEDAKEKYESMKDEESSEQLYLNGADIYLKQGDYIGALAILEEGLQKVSSDRIADRISYIKNNVVLVSITSTWGDCNISQQYDDFGNLLVQQKYNDNYEYTGCEENQYDTKGRKTNSVVYDESGKVTTKYEYVYDELGNLVCSLEYSNNDKLSATHQYGYNEFGKQIICEDYDSKGKLVWSTKTEYDSQGRKISDGGYNNKGKLKSKVETIYNTDGTVAKMVRYNERNKVVEWNETEYDANGNEIKHITYNDRNKIVYYIQTEYDANGKITMKTRHNADGIVISRKEYDVLGNVKTENLGEQQNVYEYGYRYVGDVLSENEIQDVSGKIKISKTLCYRNVPKMDAAYKGKVYTDKTYEIIGETEDFYQLSNGVYIEKSFAGIAYATIE
ncbi:MAG: zinc-ribbon domain-containing protein [Lachnospiraceae bacterium]|nr:zinc-ribbon domain-containing protein [Lachnospiraceae bacterium]